MPPARPDRIAQFTPHLSDARPAAVVDSRPRTSKDVTSPRPGSACLPHREVTHRIAAVLSLPGHHNAQAVAGWAGLRGTTSRGTRVHFRPSPASPRPAAISRTPPVGKDVQRGRFGEPTQSAYGGV
jgi:hypothetical protein